MTLYPVMWISSLGISCFQIFKNNYINDIIGYTMLIINIILIYFLYRDIKNKKLVKKEDDDKIALINADEKFRELLLKGKRIAAIKRFRIITKSDLLTAQRYVDSVL